MQLILFIVFLILFNRLMPSYCLRAQPIDQTMCQTYCQRRFISFKFQFRFVAYRYPKFRLNGGQSCFDFLEKKKQNRKWNIADQFQFKRSYKSNYQNFAIQIVEFVLGRLQFVLRIEQCPLLRFNNEEHIVEIVNVDDPSAQTTSRCRLCKYFLRIKFSILQMNS